MMTRILALTATVVLTATASQADPIKGKWRTIADDNGFTSIVEIASCGQKLCGAFAEIFDSSGASVDSDQLGRMIITEAVQTEEGKYEGRIYVPDRDRTYNSRLELSGEKLKVFGCVFGICRDGGTWTRVK